MKNPYSEALSDHGRKALLWAVASVITVSMLVAPIDSEAIARPAWPIDHGLVKTEVEAFLDGRVSAALERGDVGAVSVVVVDGSGPLVSRSWGYANAESGTKMDPATHLVRPASISKLFTWLLILQLADEGHLDLDTDVHRYLDFSIPSDGFDQPITLRHLMTHRAGFEERVEGLFATPDSSVRTNDAWLKKRIPPRIFPPGAVPAYSNYGAALAGHIIERVTEKPFEQVVEERLMSKIGMSNSTFRQPVPDEFAPRLASGYSRRSSGAESFEWLVPSPAGGMSATPDDMGRFLSSMLSKSIPLAPSTIDAIWQFETSVYPSFPPMALGFYRADRNGFRVFAHGGDTRFFHSNLLVIPDANVGLFISISGTGKDGAGPNLRKDIGEGFIDRFLPGDEPYQPVTLTGPAPNQSSIAGMYRLSRGWFRSVLSFTASLQPLRVSELPDGRIVTSSLMNLAGHPMHWRPISSDLWLAEDGRTQLTVTRDSSNAVSSLGVSSVAPIAIWLPAPGGSFHLPALVASALILVLALILMPLRWFLHRRYRVNRSSSALRRIARWGVLCGTVGLTALALAISQLLELSPTDIWIRLAQITLIASALSLAPAALASAQEFKNQRSLLHLLTDILVMLSIAAPIAILASEGFFATDIGY